jgi:spermidine synthase
MPARSLTAIDARNSRWGRITIERSARTGAVNYRQGGYYQSRADRNGVSLLTYIHAMFGLIRQRRAQSALLIGCAGGSLATMLAREGCAVTAVDINPQAFDLARRYFGLPDEVDCRPEDGAEFLFSGRRKFDAIVHDAFHGPDTPEHLLSEAFFSQAQKRLTPKGALFINVHVANDRDNSAREMAVRLAAVWREVRILDLPRRKYRNAVVMAGSVRSLKRPKLLMTPALDANAIADELSAMRFVLLRGRAGAVRKA